MSHLPNPADIRARLTTVLATARVAETMPWKDREARVWRIVFPNMANWLPAAEAAELRRAFAREMRRLDEAA